MRMRTKWFKNPEERTIDETAGALAFNYWQIGFDSIKHLRKSEFQVFNPIITIDFLAEYVAFLIHLTDRRIYGKLTEEERGQLIQSLAQKLAITYQDNATDALGPDDHKAQLFNLINQRMGEYSHIHGEGEALEYSLSRAFAAAIEEHADAKDKGWVVQQMIEIEIPDALDLFNKIFNNLIPLDE